MSEIIRSKQLTASVLLAASIGAMGLTSCSWRESDSSQQPPVETELPSPAVTELPTDSPEDDESEQSPDSPADPNEVTYPEIPDIYKKMPEASPLPIGPDDSIENAIPMPMPNYGIEEIKPIPLSYAASVDNFIDKPVNALAPEYPNRRSELIHLLEHSLATYDDDPRISHEDIKDQIEQIQKINRLAFEEVNSSESPNIFTQFEEYYGSKINVSFGAVSEGKYKFVAFNVKDSAVVISYEFQVKGTWYTISSTYSIDNLNPVSLSQALKAGEKPDKITVNAFSNKDYELLMGRPNLFIMAKSPKGDNWIAATEVAPSNAFGEVADLPFVNDETAKALLTQTVSLAKEN